MATASRWRGVAFSGGEFSVAGHYYPSSSGVQLIVNHGHKVGRVAVKWEYLQPTLNGALDATELGRLTTFLGYCQTFGLNVVIDLHNYGRYKTSDGVTHLLNDGTLTDAHFANFWTRLVTALNSYSCILGWELMNEPHDLPATSGNTAAHTWELSCQAAVNAIRALDPNRVIWVPLYQWQDPSSVATNHPNGPWVTSTGPVKYAGHFYLDYNGSGVYTNPYATDNANAVSHGYASLRAMNSALLKPFTDWLTAHNVQGVISETGWPFDGTDQATWQADGEIFYQALDAANLDATYWSVGSYDSAPNAEATTAYNFSTNTTLAAVLPQATVIEAHPSVLDTTPVTVVPGTLGLDSFTRTVASGWGTAEVGGPWATSNDGSASAASVNGTQGVVSDVAGSTVVNRLGAISNLSTEVLATVSLPVLPNAGNAYFRLVPRSVSDTPTAQTSYAIVVQIASTGAVNLGWVVNGGAVTYFPTSVTAYTVGQQLTVRAQAVGASPTTLRARLWTGTTEPSTWLVNQTDSTAGLQGAAAAAVVNYLSASTTNGPLRMLWDTVLVTALTGNVIHVSATTANTYVITATATPQNGGAMAYAISPTTGTSVVSPGVFTAPVPPANTQVTYTVTATETYGPSGATSTQTATTSVSLDGGTGSSTTSTASFASRVRVNGVWQ